MPDAHLTRHTLLQRACDVRDERAWSEFVQNYRRFILYVLNELGVLRDDLEDVTQQILLALTRDLPSYDHTRGRFRTWLSTVIRNAAYDYFRKKNCRQKHLRVLEDEQVTTPEFHAPEISLLIEKEWSVYIASLAMARVRKVFRGQAIQVFELGLDGSSIAQIASQTGLTVSSIYTLRKRVKKRLYLEIRAVSAELEP